MRRVTFTGGGIWALCKMSGGMGVIIRQIVPALSRGPGMDGLKTQTRGDYFFTGFQEKQVKQEKGADLQKMKAAPFYFPLKT